MNIMQVWPLGRKGGGGGGEEGGRLQGVKKYKKKKLEYNIIIVFQS